MRKSSLLLLLIILLIITSPTEAKSLALESGIIYNNLIYSRYSEGKEITDYSRPESLNQGAGVYGAGTYWLTDDFGLGLGIEKSSVAWAGTKRYMGGRTGDFKYTCRLVGPYGELKYKLAETTSLDFNLGYYHYEEHYFAENYWPEEDFAEVLESGRSLGIKIGTSNYYSITDNLNFHWDFGYRYLLVKINKDYNWDTDELEEVNRKLLLQGLSARGGIIYKF